MKQTLAIIGAASGLGRALSFALVDSQYRLILADENPQRSGILNSFIARLKVQRPMADIEQANSAHEACWEADIILLALSSTEERRVAEKIGVVATQKVVISSSIPTEENQASETEYLTESAAELLQAKLSNSIIAKAFATNVPADFRTQDIYSEKKECFIAANTLMAIRTVKAIALAAGFTPVVAGPLSASRELENINCLVVCL